MAYRKTSGRLTAQGKRKLEGLLKNPLVVPYHKTLIRAKLRSPKNISKSDSDMLKQLLNIYK
jgi:hypothetical protein